MRLTRYMFVALVALTGGAVSLSLAPAPAPGDEGSPPAFDFEIPAGYRDWRLISVAHEEGNLNDLRAILGNDIAINAFRAGKLPFPDGAIIARLAWKYVPSEENNRVFGRQQSFVTGDVTNIQFMIKDYAKYPSTGGWGFAQFNDGKPVDAVGLGGCYACHVPVKARDFVFSRYAP